jgi:hypothetical protein
MDIQLEAHLDANGKNASPLLPDHIKNYFMIYRMHFV